MPRDGLLLIQEHGEAPRVEVSDGPFFFDPDAGADHLDGVVLSWDDGERALRIRGTLFGSTPVYWQRDEERLVIGSRIRSLFEAGVPRAIDPLGAAPALAGLPLKRGRTLFQGISELPPGHLLIARDGQVTLESALSPSAREEVEPKRLREIVAEAVHRRLDVGRTFCALSGGVDSSWILALAAASGREVVPVCVEDAGRSPEEMLAAARLCSALDLPPRMIRLGGADLAAFLPEAVEASECLLWNGLAAERYLAFRRLHEEGAVLLSGAGADELFVGRPDLLEKDARGRPAWRLRLLEDASVVRSLVAPGWTSAVGRPPRPIGTDPRSFLLSYLLPNSTLPVETRSAAACGLRVRFPYLDPQVVMAARSLGLGSLVEGGLGKMALRRAALEDLPRDHAMQVKRSGLSPAGGGLRSRRQWLLLYRRWLSREALAALEFLRPQAVSDLLDAFAVIPSGDPRRGVIDRVLLRLTSLSVLQNGLIMGMTRALTTVRDDLSERKG